MKEDEILKIFLGNYEQQIVRLILRLRQVISSNLPDIIEQVDLPAKMIAYIYGQKYSEMVCTIIPSKKGIKLGFNRGLDLPDPDHLFKGTGKISRYVQIKTEEQIESSSIKILIGNALKAYKQRQ